MFAAVVDLVVRVGWGSRGNSLLATGGAGSSSGLAIVRRFSRLEGAVDGRNCSLPDLLDQSFRDNALFVTDSSRNKVRSEDWQSYWSAVASIVGTLLVRVRKEGAELLLSR